jgi:hypothetical protein
MGALPPSAVDQALERTIRRLDLATHLRPNDAEGAIRAFLARGDAPQLTYDVSTRERLARPVVLPLDQLDAPEEVRQLYVDKERELVRTRELLRVIGGQDFTAASRDLFGEPSPEDVAQARETLTRLADVRPPCPSAPVEVLVARLRERLAALGLALEVVVEPSLMTEITVDAALGTIRLSPRLSTAPEQLERLLVHEIDVHARRVVNGARLPWGLFRLGASGYRETEEGLAVYWERRGGHLYPWQEKLYAARCVATDLALRAGFVEVVEALEPSLGREAAARVALRVKRGLRDTSRPGGQTKEHHYVSGERLVARYVGAGGRLEPLFGAKIGLAQAPLLQALAAEGWFEPQRWSLP